MSSTYPSTDANAKSALENVQSLLQLSPQLRIVGGGSKSGLQVDSNLPTISSKPFQGVVSYEPQEFVITVLAGTPIADVIQLVAAQGQYLPFDPLLPARGATVGGTIAANASGPGRFRFGGVRDFLIGVRFIDGRGISIRGGGQVVKNAAGFDYPKLLVGSRGQLGFIYEATLKVFPRPECYATFVAHFESIELAVNYMNRMASSQFDVDSLDLIPANDGTIYKLAIRIGGLPSSIGPRIDHLRRNGVEGQILLDYEDASYWSDSVNLGWTRKSAGVLKCPITASRIVRIEEKLRSMRWNRRYSVAGNVLWLELPADNSFDENEFADLFHGQLFLGYLHSGAGTKPPFRAGPFGQAIKKALDPDSKFV